MSASVVVPRAAAGSFPRSSAHASARRAKGPAAEAKIFSARRAKGAAPEAKILFQQFFKSVGPRTYAAQVKEAGNGNQFIVLTESKRIEGEEPPRKTRLFVFSEDFIEFFKLVKATAEFVKANPVSDEIKSRRRKYWDRTHSDGPAKGGPLPQKSFR